MRPFTVEGKPFWATLIFGILMVLLINVAHRTGSRGLSDGRNEKNECTPLLIAAFVVLSLIALVIWCSFHPSLADDSDQLSLRISHRAPREGR